MAKSMFLMPRRGSWRAVLTSLSASAMLAVSAFSPATLAVAAP